MRMETIYGTWLAQRRSPINVSSPSPASHVLLTLALELLNWTLLMLRGRDLSKTSNRSTSFRRWKEGESLSGVAASVELGEWGEGGGPGHSQKAEGRLQNL